MKHLKIIAVALIVSLGAPQMQALHTPEWLNKVKTFDYKALGQKSLEYVQPVISKAQQWVKNNPKKTIAMASVAGIYALWKLGFGVYKRCAWTPMKQFFSFDPQYDGLPKKGEQKTALIFSVGFTDGQENTKKFLDSKEMKQSTLGNNLASDFFTVTFNYSESELFAQHRQKKQKEKEKKDLNNNSTNSIAPESTTTFEDIVSIIDGLSALSRINLGGLPDAEILLYPIIQCADAGTDIVLYGHSRGAAAIIRVLHMLTFPNQYMSTWKKFDLTKRTWGFKFTPDYDRISKIAGKIKQVFVANPLLSTETVLANIGGDFAKKLLGKKDKDQADDKKEFNDLSENEKKYYLWMNNASDVQNNIYEKAQPKTGCSSEECIGKSAQEALGIGTSIFTATRYPHFEKQPIKLLQELCSKNNTKTNFKLHFSFAEKDEVVTNEYDATVKALEGNKDSQVTVTVAENKNQKTGKMAHNNSKETWTAIRDFVLNYEKK